MPVSTHEYNTARNRLIDAGSITARNSHPKHGRNAWPDDHGIALLREARDERNGMNIQARALYRAEVVFAAGIMHINQW